MNVIDQAVQARLRTDTLADDSLALLREAYTALNWQGAEYLAKRIKAHIEKLEGKP